MAIMIPSIPNDYAPESREGELFASLQKLSNDYYVFHSFRIMLLMTIGKKTKLTLLFLIVIKELSV